MTSTSSTPSSRINPARQLLQRVMFGALVLGGCGDKEPAGTGAATKTTTEGESSTGSSSGGETGTTTNTQPTTGTTGSTGGGGSTGTTCSFLGCEATSGGIEPVCDNWAQDCPEGQKCMPAANDGSTAWNTTVCTDVNPAKKQPGDECTVEGSGVSGIDDCDKGVMCWEVDPATNIGTCVAQCTGSPDAPLCGLGGTCFISNDGVLNLCLPLCDPLAQDCPGTGLCIPNPKNNAEFTCVLDASGEEGQAFDACEYINVCDKGLLCANPMLATECDPAAIGCCLPFCPLDEVPSMCPGANLECIPWFDVGTAPPGYENVGFCGIPMG
jgi:hypothetical protein